MDANALLGGEVEALGKRLEDVRESLTQLADVAEGKLSAKNEAKKDIVGQRTFLDSVQRVSVIQIGNRLYSYKTFIAYRA